MVGNNVKLPLFQGNKTEYLEQYWFICEAVWTVKQVQDEDIKKGHLGKPFKANHLIGT